MKKLFLFLLLIFQIFVFAQTKKVLYADSVIFKGSVRIEGGLAAGDTLLAGFQSDTSAIWGYISGTLTNQSDLVAKFGTKTDTSTFNSSISSINSSLSSRPTTTTTKSLIHDTASVTYNNMISTLTDSIRNLKKFIIPIPFLSPATGDTILLCRAQRAFTIDSINIATKDSSVTLNFLYCVQAFSGTGTKVWLSDQSATSRQGANYYPNNSSISKGYYLRLIIVSVAGTVNEQFWGQIYCSYP